MNFEATRIKSSSTMCKAAGIPMQSYMSLDFVRQAVNKL